MFRGDKEKIKLTRFTHGLGCACKLRPQLLEEILKKIPIPNDKNILVGTNTSDDAAVYRLDDKTAIVQSVDFFTPIVDEPFDFSKKNRLPLVNLHSLVRSVMFPEAVPVKQRFNLTKDDYDFLHRYMSMMPGESTSPLYDTPAYWDTYAKFLLYGAEKGAAEPHIRIFNKIGDAYGFMIDAAYVADFKNNVEFILSAVIYCNSDGIFNDDKYDYDSVGYPFMKHLGRVIYDHELKRERKYKPDLSAFQFDYR
jgi:hypothetical protein